MRAKREEPNNSRKKRVAYERTEKRADMQTGWETRVSFKRGGGKRQGGENREERLKLQ